MSRCCTWIFALSERAFRTNVTLVLEAEERRYGQPQAQKDRERCCRPESAWPFQSSKPCNRKGTNRASEAKLSCGLPVGRAARLQHISEAMSRTRNCCVAFSWPSAGWAFLSIATSPRAPAPPPPPHPSSFCRRRRLLFLLPRGHTQYTDTRAQTHTTHGTYMYVK